MKTKEELNALKAEVRTLSQKLAELNEDELAQVVGGEDEESELEYKLLHDPRFRDPRAEEKLSPEEFLGELDLRQAGVLFGRSYDTYGSKSNSDKQ